MAIGPESKLAQEIKASLPSIHGWCKPEKALKLAEYVIASDAKLCVEIGVYGGSSLLPMAMAIRTLPMLESGNPLVNADYRRVVGIDPWTNDAATDGMKEQVNVDWWSKVDLEMIYQSCLVKIDDYRLNNYVTLLRAKSDDVVGDFQDETIDLLHIDGNHCEARALNDVVNYLPKVRQNGIVVFDDVWWCEGGEVTTRKAVLLLLDQCIKLDVIGGDCMILQKR
jgi:hypothetical protein